MVLRNALVLLAALPTLAFAAAPPEIKIQESLPKGLAVDGDLKEWTGEPSATLGPSQQVAGPVKLAAPSDLSATVWVAFTKEGMAVAGKVTDDKVKFADPSKVFADHAEIWIALPAAPMPPLAYANQFGEIEVPDAAACDTLEEIEDPATCKAWVTEQRRRRSSLERLFLRQYLLTPSGITEAWSTPAKAGSPHEPPQKGCCSASKSVVKEAPGGWVFEALIAADDFPATSQIPLVDLGLLVDVVDADDQIEKLESFVSTSSRRKLGRSSTFSAVTLREGIVWETNPPLLGLFGKGHDIFFFPGKNVASAYAFDNHPVGYQYQPKEPSPSVHEMKISGDPIAKLGDLSVYWVQSPHGHGLYSFRGGVKVDGEHSDGALVSNLKRSGTDTHQFLIKEEGTVSALGTGACGACPVHKVLILSLDKSGTFKELLSEEIAEGVPDDEDLSMFEDVKFEHEKEFIRVGFTGKKLDADGKPTPFKKHWQWDSKQKTYVPAK